MAEVNLEASRQGELSATNIAVLILGIFFVGLRFASRQMKGIGIGMDDYFTLIALFFFFAVFASCMIGIHYGLGKHAQALTTPQIVSYAKSLIAFECIYVTCVCFTKLAVLLMYRRIFPVRSIRIGSMILGGISVAWCISIIMVSIFQCVPLKKVWDPNVEGRCVNLKKSFVGNAIPNIATDVAILALPMREVWRLQTSTVQKCQISFVFLLGSFVVFTAIYRFTTLFQFEPSDITWTLATAQIWCVVESAAGIISACLPTLGPLVQIGIRKFGITTGLTWGSQQKTPASGASDLQTIGGSGAPKKVVKVTDTFDDTPMTKSKGSRAFQRLSEYSGNSDEHVGWVNKSELKSSVRAHDVEKDRGESDEIPLHNIVIRTDVEWQESQSRK